MMRRLQDAEPGETLSLRQGSRLVIADRKRQVTAQDIFELMEKKKILTVESPTTVIKDSESWQFELRPHNCMAAVTGEIAETRRWEWKAESELRLHTLVTKFLQESMLHSHTEFGTPDLREELEGSDLVPALIFLLKNVWPPITKDINRLRKHVEISVRKRIALWLEPFAERNLFMPSKILPMSERWSEAIVQGIGQEW